MPSRLSLRWMRRAALAAGLTLASCARSEPEPVNPAAETLADFSRRVQDYATLRNNLADSLGPLNENQTQAEIAVRAARLAAAIQQARTGAEQGQLFTPEVSTVIASMIQEEYRRRPAPVLQTREDQQDELHEDRPVVFDPVVNQLYPTTYPLATFPPALLPLLPQLPEQLEYRIVGRHLILRDVEANLIIDVLPDAMPQ